MKNQNILYLNVQSSKIQEPCAFMQGWCFQNDFWVSILFWLFCGFCFFNINPISTEGGPFGPEQLKTVWHFHSFMAGVTKIHDFVYFSICLVPVKLFWEKKLWIFENIEKNNNFNIELKLSVESLFCNRFLLILVSHYYQHKSLPLNPVPAVINA